MKRFGCARPPSNRTRVMKNNLGDLLGRIVAPQEEV